MEYDGTAYVTGNDTGTAATTWTITNADGTGDTGDITWVQPASNNEISIEPGAIIWGQKTLKKRNSDWDEVDKMFKEKL